MNDFFEIEESHCSAPPLVENSRLLSSNEGWGVGTTTQYLCEKGFYITGQSEIVCDDDNGEVDWSGELPECRKLGKEIMINLFLNRCFQHKICYNIKVIVDCISNA